MEVLRIWCEKTRGGRPEKRGRLYFKTKFFREKARNLGRGRLREHWRPHPCSATGIGASLSEGLPSGPRGEARGGGADGGWKGPALIRNYSDGLTQQARDGKKGRGTAPGRAGIIRVVHVVGMWAEFFVGGKFVGGEPEGEKAHIQSH